MDETLLVRPARTSELPLLARMDVELFGPGGYPPFFFRQAHDVFGDLLQVAELRPGGELAGYALGALAAGNPEGWLLSLAVRPEHRGHGIGARLARSICEFLALRGAQEVRLTVEPDNAAATRLYASAGFAALEREDDYFGPGAARLVMRWRPA